MRPFTPFLCALVLVSCARFCQADVVILQVDIGVSDGGAPNGVGSSPNVVQAGFSEFSAPHDFALTGLDQNNIGVLSLSRQFGGIGVQLISPQGNGALYQDYAGTVTHALGDLAADGLFARFGVGIQMEITGLGAGIYQMTTWHHSSVDMRPGGFNISTSINNGAQSLVGSGLVQSRGLAPSALTEANFGFELSNPGSSLQVTFSSGNNPDVMTVLNGFRITAVPEPNGIALLCCALPLFRMRREVSS